MLMARERVTVLNQTLLSYLHAPPVDEWLALLSYLHVIDYRVDEWLAEPLRQLRCLHRHVGCLRPSDRAIQNNSGLPQRRRLGALSHSSLSSWRR